MWKIGNDWVVYYRVFMLIIDLKKVISNPFLFIKKKIVYFIFKGTLILDYMSNYFYLLILTSHMHLANIANSRFAVLNFFSFFNQIFMLY